MPNYTKPGGKTSKAPKYPGNMPKSGSNALPRSYDPKTTWAPGGGRPLGAIREYNQPQDSRINNRKKPLNKKGGGPAGY